MPRSSKRKPKKHISYLPRYVEKQDIEDLLNQYFKPDDYDIKVREENLLCLKQP